MKIVLAGAETFGYESSQFHKNILFSYHYMKDNKPEKIKFLRDRFIDKDCEIICDSGLFTFMFGSGSGGEKKPASFWSEYAERYLDTASKWGFRNITFVECDTHKVLGMEETFRIREVFKKSGLPILYVWHVEETIPGLLKLAEENKYIAISVPELRKVFKGNTTKYQDAVVDLQQKIFMHFRKIGKPIPKIHLLGCTVTDLMKTKIAYSCDSTSWLSGVRYGNCVLYRDGDLINCHSRSPAFVAAKQDLIKTNIEMKQRFEKENRSKTGIEYLYNLSVNAKSYHLFNDYLDRSFQWVNK